MQNSNIIIHKEIFTHINVHDSIMVTNKKKITQINVHVESHDEPCDV